MDIGGVNLRYLGHDGFLITTPKKVIAIDPYNIPENVPKADIILITHSHYDHCSIKDIITLSKEGTTIIVSPDSQSKITRIEGVNMQVIEIGDEISLNEIKISSVPAYNLNKPFHPKNEGWMGYVIKYDKLIIYHAGDTDLIPDMQKLTGYAKHGNEFIALLPVSGNYVMDSHEAAQAAALLKPSLAIPMHYGAGVSGTIEDAENFVKLCESQGINARILPKE